MKNINELINDLPMEDRARVKARTEQLIGEEMALQHLRKARCFTQARIAETLGIGQEGVSKIENRSDLLISTLQSYVEAMGGSLKLLVQFPDGMATLSASMLSESKPCLKPTDDRRKIQKAVKKRNTLQLARAND